MIDQKEKITNWQSTYRAIGLLWLGSLIFHSFGWSFFSVTQMRGLSFVGFFRDVERMTTSLPLVKYAAAYAEHMAFCFLYLVASAILIAVLFLRRIWTWWNPIGKVTVEKFSIIISMCLLFAIGAYFMLSQSHSMFFTSDWRLVGMPVWIILTFATFTWPTALIMLMFSLENPRNVNKLWHWRWHI